MKDQKKKTINVGHFCTQVYFRYPSPAASDGDQRSVSHQLVQCVYKKTSYPSPIQVSHSLSLWVSLASLSRFRVDLHSNLLDCEKIFTSAGKSVWMCWIYYGMSLVPVFLTVWLNVILNKHKYNTRYKKNIRVCILCSHRIVTLEILKLILNHFKWDTGSFFLHHYNVSMLFQHLLTDWFPPSLFHQTSCNRVMITQ